MPHPATSPPSNGEPEHVAEVAAILATGLIRLVSPKSRGNSTAGPESSLDFAGDRSAHAENSREPETVDGR